MATHLPLLQHFLQLCEAIQEENYDVVPDAVRAVLRAAEHAPPADVQEVLSMLCEVVEVAHLGLEPLPGLVVGLTDRATDPTVALPTLVQRAIEAMEWAARFAELYQQACGSDPPNVEESGDRFPAVQQAFVSTVTAIGVPRDDAVHMLIAWYTADSWVPPVLFLCQRKEFRTALTDRNRLLAATNAMRDRLASALWLNRLLQVVDDEQVLVLDSTFADSGRGFRVTISGIGDNFQLHTLLAAALVGAGSVGRLPGQRPPAAEIEAATAGEQVRLPRGLHGVWEMADAHGEPIWHEGRPADIPTFDGERVIVLVRAPFPRGWNPGRLFPLMRPELTVDAELSPAEAAGWLGRIKTA